MASQDAPKNDPILDELRDEFLTDARERVFTIEQALSRCGTADSDALLTVRREVHNLKGMGTSFGFPVISLIAHRLEDFIAGLTCLGAHQSADAAVFVDRIHDILESGHDPDAEAAQALIRGLPAFPNIEAGVDEARYVEVLLVCPSRVVSHIALRTLRSLGYRVTMARSAWEAIELAVRVRPDLIITSAVMSGIGGIDLARAFAAMTATQDLPVALLTSFAEDHPELKRLPSQVSVVRLGKTFDEDLAAVITGFALV